MEPLNFDGVLTDTETTFLASIYGTPGHSALNKIMKHEADKFIVSLLNEDVADEKAVLAAHKLAKTAAMLYQGFVNRMNTEAAAVLQSIKQEKEGPIDVTEGLIDLGEDTNIDTDVFGGETINE